MLSRFVARGRRPERLSSTAVVSFVTQPVTFCVCGTRMAPAAAFETSRAGSPSASRRLERRGVRPVDDVLSETKTRAAQAQVAVRHAKRHAAQRTGATRAVAPHPVAAAEAYLAADRADPHLHRAALTRGGGEVFAEHLPFIRGDHWQHEGAGRCRDVGARVGVPSSVRMHHGSTVSFRIPVWCAAPPRRDFHRDASRVSSVLTIPVRDDASVSHL